MAIYKSDDVKLCVATVASHPERGYHILRESCNRCRIDITTLGSGTPFRNNLDKIRLTDAFLEAAGNEFTHILFCDGYDVVFASSLSSIVDSFLSFPSPIVFSAERGCWPDPKLETLYPTAPTPYRFLNSGLWIGEIAHVRPILKHLLQTSYSQKCDQRMFTKLFLTDAAPIALDYYCRLFQSLYLSESDLEWDPVQSTISICLIQDKPNPFASEGFCSRRFSGGSAPATPSDCQRPSAALPN